MPRPPGSVAPCRLDQRRCAGSCAARGRAPGRPPAGPASRQDVGEYGEPDARQHQRQDRHPVLGLDRDGHLHPLGDQVVDVARASRCPAARRSAGARRGPPCPTTVVRRANGPSGGATRTNRCSRTGWVRTSVSGSAVRGGQQAQLGHPGAHHLGHVPGGERGSYDHRHPRMAPGEAAGSSRSAVRRPATAWPRSPPGRRAARAPTPRWPAPVPGRGRPSGPVRSAPYRPR